MREEPDSMLDSIAALFLNVPALNCTERETPNDPQRPVDSTDTMQGTLTHAGPGRTGSGIIMETQLLNDCITGNPATAYAILSNLDNVDHISCGLHHSDVISITALVGGTALPPYAFVIGLTSRVEDLVAAIEIALHLTSGRVTVNPDGSLRIAHEPGYDLEVTDLVIRATDNSGMVPRKTFNAAMIPGELWMTGNAEP